MHYRALALDIDGTLVTTQKTLTSRTKEGLIALQKQGALLILASGRPTPGLLPLARQLRMDELGGYLLSFNGGRVTTADGQRLLAQATLSPSLLPELYQAAQELGVGIVTYDERRILAGTTPDRYMNLESSLTGMPLEYVPDWPAHIDFAPNKCLMTGPEERIAQIESVMKARFGAQLNVYRSEGFFLELMPQCVDKAYGLTQLLQHLPFDSSQVVCCGDGYNDIAMLRFAGVGVAMANAKPEVLRIADYVTRSNDEDGVLYAAKRFFPLCTDTRSFPSAI